MRSKAWGAKRPTLASASIATTASTVPSRQIPGRAKCGGDKYAAVVDDLVARKQVTVDGEARLLSEITAGHRQLGVRVSRCASRTEQFRRRITGQHALPRREQERPARSGGEISWRAREHVNVVEQPVVPGTTEHACGEKPALHSP
jgi:hypothetical protein